MKTWVGILFLFFSSAAVAKEKLVFLVNTQGEDSTGGVTTPYLDEHYDEKVLRKAFPQATIRRVRANSLEGIRKGVELWMLPAPHEKEVVGLYISSHGGDMYLDTDKGFLMQLPFQIPLAFAPLIGHFAPRALIIFNGCSILEDRTESEARYSLESILDTFKITDGMVYANKSFGALYMRYFANSDVTNPDIDLANRAAGLALYGTWWLSLPSLYVAERFLNQGYLLDRTPEKQWIYPTNYFNIFRPGLLR